MRYVVLSVIPLNLSAIGYSLTLRLQGPISKIYKHLVFKKEENFFCPTGFLRLSVISSEKIQIRGS